MPQELRDVDAVVFDPPRQGAQAQAQQLAASKVPAIVAVSCNAATFARDARILIDGGYRCERVTPIVLTALVTGFALLPIAAESGQAGREIEGPMALVILGGLMTSLCLVLMILPALIWRWRFARGDT